MLIETSMSINHIELVTIEVTYVETTTDSACDPKACAIWIEAGGLKVAPKDERNVSTSSGRW